jgi:hypothetical protein
MKFRRRPFVTLRNRVLVAVGLASLVALHQFLRNSLLANVLLAKGRPQQLLVAVSLIAIPFLWAAVIEWVLRRFVDRPPDSGDV